MGRKKVELKRIENESNRHVSFTKRRSGLMKKAREISVLCGVEVGLIVFSDQGKLYDFCSGNSLPNVIERYKSHPDKKTRGLIGIDSKDHQSNQATLESLGKLLQTVPSQVEEPNTDKIKVTDLVQQENQLEAALSQIRSQKIGARVENSNNSNNMTMDIGKAESSSLIGKMPQATLHLLH